jgi:hypothetical protein
MNYVKPRFRLICLALMAGLCLMAVSAASAQASGNWRIEGANIAQEKAIVSEEDQKFTFLVDAMHLEIFCNQFKLDEGKLLPGGKILGNLLFKECATYFTTPKLMRASVCDPVGGEIKLLALGLLILHNENKKTYVRFTPDGFATFGAINYGAECVLPKAAISGSFVLEDCSLANKLETEAFRHLVQQAPAGLFPEDILLYGGSEMRLDGSVRLQLVVDPLELWSGLT